MKNFNLKKYLAENKLLKEEYSIPSQEEVDKFFTDTQNEIHYLASKPVMGQKGDRVRSEIEPWDEYDLSNWNALVRKAKLSEDRKAKEYIKSISDPEEREAERKRMFGDDELDEATDFNDPALIAARAAQMKRDKIEADEKDKQSYLNKKYGSSFMDKLEAEIDLKNELADLEDEREDVLRNMEEEAEPEGGEIADDYGSILNNMDAKIAAIKSDLDDLRMYESVKEITTSPVSGTKAGVIYSLDNRKYVLTNDVKGARIGDYTNITLPKGTVMYNLPGGLMADHESLRQYAKLSGNIYFDKPTYAGVGIRRMPDILTAIENNSNVIEESLNEELKLGVKYKLPTGETGYIMTGGSKDSKDWTFSANKEPYLSVKDKLKPTEKQPGKYDGAYDMGMGKGHHIDEGTCGYGEDGKIGDKPAGPDLNEMEDEIPAFMMRDGMYRELVDDSVSYNDFEKRIYGFVGPKFYKSIHSEHPGALKNFYDKFRITNPNLEEESDTDVGGGAEQDNRDYNFSDADDGAYAEEHSGVVGENKEFDFKKMVKEALTPDYLKK